MRLLHRRMGSHFQEVANADPGNVLISPISIKILLNMLYEGSSGETAKELEKKLQLPSDKNLARMKASAVLRSLQVCPCAHLPYSSHPQNVR